MPDPNQYSTSIYKASSHSNVLSEAKGIVCLLQPRAVLIAGLSEQGEVLMIHEDSYTEEEGPEWLPSFFEQHFINDALLGGPNPATVIAVAGTEHLLVPDELTSRDENESWLRSLYLIAPTTDILHWRSTSDEATWYFCIPTEICKLLNRYMDKVLKVPAAAYQLYKPNVKRGFSLQALLLGSDCAATLRENGRLMWHGNFTYSCHEDIAWNIANVCRQYKAGIIDVDMEFCCSSKQDEMLGQLSCYFPKLRTNREIEHSQEGWAAVICLLQQLYACAL